MKLLNNFLPSMSGPFSTRKPSLCPPHPTSSVQKNMETRERQFKMWSDMILAYAKNKKVYTLTLGEMYDSPLCNN